MKNLFSRGLKLMPFAATFLVILQLIISNELAVFGGRMRQMDIELSAVSAENEALVWKLASATSLQMISQRAGVLGLQENNTAPAYVQSELSVALRAGNP